jgi:DNA polymerase-3 subunit alpha
MSYISLHNHSHYSILDSLIRVDQLLGIADEYKMEAVAITDHGNCFGHNEFWKLHTDKKGKFKNVKPIFGCEIYVEDGIDKLTHMILLAKNNNGLQNLYSIVSDSNRNFKKNPRTTIPILNQYGKDLICMSACIGGYTARPFIKNDEAEGMRRIDELLNIFKDDFYLEVQDENTKYYNSNDYSEDSIRSYMKESTADLDRQEIEMPEQVLIKKIYREIGKRKSIPVVCSSDPHYVKPGDALCHDILLCIRSHSVITDDKRTKENPKGRRFAFPCHNFYFKNEKYMLSRFTKEEVENTHRIAKMCNATIEKRKTYPKYKFVPSGETSVSYTKSLLNSGWKRLKIDLKSNKDEYKKRLHHEFEVLAKYDLLDYFLVLKDIVNFCESKDIDSGPGRGSAAGSLLLYILGITKVDPIKHELMFGRFFNEARMSKDAGSGLDVDMDFQRDRRDEVFAYIKERFGQDCVAPIMTIGTLDSKSAVKAVGRALGLNYDDVNRITKECFPNHYEDLADAIKQENKLRQEYKKNKRLFELARMVEGNASSRGTHACGIIINDKPLGREFPLCWDPEKQHLISGIVGKDIDGLGFTKIDILGLSCLSIIKDTIKMIKDDCRGN